MARTAETPLDEPEAVVVEADEESSIELEREVGSVVEAAAVPFERRKDGSIAYFTSQATTTREVGS